MENNSLKSTEFKRMIGTEEGKSIKEGEKIKVEITTFKFWVVKNDTGLGNSDYFVVHPYSGKVIGRLVRDKTKRLESYKMIIDLGLTMEIEALKAITEADKLIKEGKVDGAVCS